jgi:hypothetical protein
VEQGATGRDRTANRVDPQNALAACSPLPADSGMCAAPGNRQPWPMKWIVLAIVLCLGSYTFLTLRYRKPGPAFRPYEDLKNRANVSRLLAAGYRRVSLPAERPADPMRPMPTAPVASTAGGLPSPLAATLVEPPVLPSSIERVAAPATIGTHEPYVVRFSCTLPDHRRQPASADLYIKGDQLVIAPDFEKIPGELLARTDDSIIQLTVPAGTLPPGRYRVTLVGQQSSRAWTLQVH